jgi:hypothetical protein
MANSQKLQTKKGDDKYYIQGFGGQFWSVEPKTNQLSSSSRNVGRGESIQIMRTDGGKCLFRTANRLLKKSRFFEHIFDSSV